MSPPPLLQPSPPSLLPDNNTHIHKYMHTYMDNNNSKNKPLHIAVVPTPGMGHLIPIAELAKTLITLHPTLTFTFITFAESASKTQNTFLSSLPPSSFSSLYLPPVDLSHLPPGSAIETIMSTVSARSVPALTLILSGLQKAHGRVIYIADLFGADTIDAAKSLAIPAYMFFPSNFHTLSLILSLPELDRQFSCEFRELTEPVKLPGCVPIPGVDILTPVSDKKNEAYTWMVHHGDKYREAQGILVNTFDEIEPEVAQVFKKNEPGRPPIYSVGPLIQTGRRLGGSADDGSGCLAWLDNQPRGSVLFVSFGSGGTLSTEQTKELALGLELSGVRFLWVVRSPSDDESNANYFDAESKSDPFAHLPPGFIERTSGVGLVVPSWAPQIEVLGHDATGGFLTHCGWNSTLESVSNGVPMITWPLFAEQFMNAVMLVDGVKAALRPKFGSDGIARKKEIAEVVKELMEGEKGKAVRHKVKELQEAGVRALGEEGRSYKALTQIVNKWML